MLVALQTAVKGGHGFEIAVRVDNLRGGDWKIMPIVFEVFRAEKRSAQASAHPLSQAQGGLFCVLTVFVCWSSE